MKHILRFSVVLIMLICHQLCMSVGIYLMLAVIDSEKVVSEQRLDFCTQDTCGGKASASLKLLVPGNLMQEISWVTFLISFLFQD